MRLLGGARALGFTLIEIAIVLVVVGLIVSGGLLGLSPLLQANKVSQTNEQMDKIEQALVLYVIQNGCLPCPASAANVNATTGGQASDSAAYSTGCGNNTTCAATYGVVPWVNLGLSRNDVTDPYGSFIDYATGTGLNTSSLSMVRIPPSTYPTGDLEVFNLANAQQTSAAAYLLISHGPDGSYGHLSANGTQKTDPNSARAQACNGAGQTTACTAAGTPTYASGSYIQDQPRGSATAGNYFDDIVRYKTAPVIVQSCGSNACGNPA